MVTKRTAHSRITAVKPKPQPANRTRAVAAVVHHHTTDSTAAFLSRHQVAALTGLNLQLIDAAIKGGRLEASKIGKRRVVIARTAVDAWIAEQRV